MAQNTKKYVWSEERKPESPIKTITPVTQHIEADTIIQHNATHSTAKLITTCYENEKIATQ